MSFIGAGRAISRRVFSCSLIPLHRSYSVRSSTASSSFGSSSLRAFEWKKLVTPHTPPETIEAFKEIDQSVSKLAADVASTPAAPEAINWDKWTKTIKTSGAVAEIKKHYEATLNAINDAEKTSAVKKPVEIDEFNASFDKVLAKVEKLNALSEEEAIKIAYDIAWLEDFDADIGEDGIVPIDIRLEMHPGLKERLLEEYENGEFTPTDAENRLASTDIKSITDLLHNGGDIDVGGMVPGDRFGDFKPSEQSKLMKEWLHKVYGDLAKDQPVLEFEIETNPYEDDHMDDH